ncbi:MAG: glycogen debranching protein [Thermoplasmata archaeon]|nr:MAG: glycogen debranching protein [Thermoplasmata archaeon]
MDVIKTVFMPFSKNTVVIKYKFKTMEPIVFNAFPLVTSRHFYDTNETDDVFSIDQNFKNTNVVEIRFDNLDKTLGVISNLDEYKKNRRWLRLEFERDRERKEAYVDYVLQTGGFVSRISKNDVKFLAFTIENNYSFDINMLYRNEMMRKKSLIKKSVLPRRFRDLILSADSFIVKHRGKKSVIAGYHWFSNWGRDLLISLPGLTLVIGRYIDARDMLLNLGEFCNRGLIPNVFLDIDSRVAYNSVDTSLWYIDRVYQYFKYTRDVKLVRRLWNVLASIVEYYEKGTDLGIKMDDDFLISHDAGLTWMDVKVDGRFVTPRAGKAVEIQALWYNALMVMSKFSMILGYDDVYSPLAALVRRSFNKKYDKQYDVIEPVDLSCRPNKMFLLSMDFCMVEKNMRRKILEDVTRRLLTPYGLRTLSRDDPRYIGKYIGEHDKDVAYHNGCVWPWLMGAYIKGFLKNQGYSLYSRRYAYKFFLKPLLNTINSTYGIGCINEVFDGDPPFKANGCISQAWSTAEVLRAWAEDILYKRPVYEKFLLGNNQITS